MLKAGETTAPVSGDEAAQPDALWSGRRFRTFNVFDDYNREVLRIETDTSLPARRIVRALDELVEMRGKPVGLRMDNGPELISDELEKWARRHRIECRFIQPGRPMQNGLIERFNRTYRAEVLDCCVFETLGEVRRMTTDWIPLQRDPARYAAVLRRTFSRYFTNAKTQTAPMTISRPATCTSPGSGIPSTTMLRTREKP